MDNLLESNERTLVMFDAVCSGLSSCLALVHSDMKQMTEHRNKLALAERQQLELAKLAPAQELIVSNNNNNDSTTLDGHNKDNNNIGDIDSKEADDPHHLAGLKLLDKRLADSFSQVLSLNELQKSAAAAAAATGNKQQRGPGSKAGSIFHVLLGKGRSTQGDKGSKKAACDKDETAAAPDTKTIIDDINRQTRLAMQYSKQLESHLFKVEDLRSRYEMHLKMGLVVKSVARAYLSTGSSASNSQGNSPGTLNRRGHHCSSLVINNHHHHNDSSSIGTHSSLSSLNLSTWSSSRSKAAEKRRSAAAALLSNGNHHNRSQHHLQQQPDSPAYSNGSATNTERRRISSQSGGAPSAANSLAMMGQYNYGESPPQEQASFGSGGSGGGGGGYHETSTLSRSSHHLNASQASLKNKSKKQQLQASKTTIKEFIENIDKIEAEFESYMGSFLLAIEDIQGFARVCQGDVFEISIKYGDAQKFKTKISVLKENRQKCDHRQSVFKARIADVLAIKAYECKGLGKRVLLGHKLCETRDLFTARSQLMTISLNQTGSIKLNLIVTWNPLHMAPNAATASPDSDLAHLSLPTCVSTSSMSSMYSVPSVNHAAVAAANATTTTINIRSQQRASRQMTTSSPNNDHHHHHHNHHSRQSVPVSPPQQQQLHHHHHHQESMYQTLVDPIYGYTYIPPPDYLTNELRDT